MKVAVALASVVAFAAASAAEAHDPAPTPDGASTYLSQVTKIEPRVAGLAARVLDRDDRLELTNTTGKEVVVLGYDGERYLEFRRSGVYENANSPAKYLNQDRYARTITPRNAKPGAPPAWAVVATSNTYSWHDHRIHWMSPIPPPAAQREPDERHRVFDWRVPLKVGSQRVTIAGTLDYVPPPEESRLWLWLLVGTAATVASGGLLVALVQRRRRARPVEP